MSFYCNLSHTTKPDFKKHLTIIEWLSLAVCPYQWLTEVWKIHPTGWCNLMSSICNGYRHGSYLLSLGLRCSLCNIHRTPVYPSPWNCLLHNDHRGSTSMVLISLAHQEGYLLEDPPPSHRPKCLYFHAVLGKKIPFGFGYWVWHIYIFPMFIDFFKTQFMKDNRSIKTLELIWVH